MPQNSQTGLTDWQLMGEGACGTVWAAKDRDGKWLAVKSLDAMAISRPVLEKMVWRAAQANHLTGCAEIVKADWLSRPSVLITELFGKVTQDGDTVTIVPRSLQRDLDSYLASEKSWPTLNKLADALANLHRNRIAHGNVKPGNIFFQNSGELVVTDWAQGVMPDVSHLPYSDAHLYSPPEQLTRPYGYLEEAGYTWDVFAFGTLAYRLLTGHFPYCHQAFQKVAPDSGFDCRVGVDADRSMVATSVERATLRPWDTDASNETEAKRRAVIERCLEKSPNDRFLDMNEVVNRLAAIKEEAHEVAEKVRYEAEYSKEREESVFAISKGRAKYRNARLFTGLATVAALTLAGLWGFAELRQRLARDEFDSVVARLTSEHDAAAKTMTLAVAKNAEAVDALAEARDTWRKRLILAEDMNNRLFSWAVERGSTTLPTIEGRKERIALLDEYFRSFVAENGKDAKMATEVALARLNIAELAMASCDPLRASRELTIALASGGLDETGTRVIRARTLLGLLLADGGKPKEAREQLNHVVTAESAQTREELKLRVAASIALAHAAASESDYDSARQSYQRAAVDLKCLGSLQPELLAPRSSLARVQLEEAYLAEGQGLIDEAQELRFAAAKGLARLADEQPDFTPGRVELAGIHRVMAEGALMVGDHGRARQEISLAEARLDGVDFSLDTIAAVENAAIVGTDALLQRDSGSREVAVERVALALDLLRPVLLQDPTNSEAAYRRALLLLMQGAMEGELGLVSEELSKGEEAFSILSCITEESQWSPLRKRSVTREMAIAAGDLGHAAQIKSDTALAKAWLERAKDCWLELASANPQNEEYSEGAAWCKDRLEQMGQAQ